MGFFRKAAFCLNLHPKIQVQCYDLLGVMSGNGNRGSVRHRTKLSRGDPGPGWDQCFGGQNNSDLSQELQSILLIYCGVINPTVCFE